MRARFARFVHRVRSWLRPPRRLRVLRPGGFLIFGTLALGIASLNTGNNLLYLLMGALLGTIALSGWLSEQALRKLRIQRRLPRAATAGDGVRIEYDVRNAKPRLPSHGVEIGEIVAAPAQPRTRRSAYILALEPGAVTRARGELRFARRGVYTLSGVTLATAFPFGIFVKERDIDMPGSLIVWPRTDTVVRAPRIGGRRGHRQLSGAGTLAGAERGDFRGLRQYRPGDDPRDVHWRTSARRGEPIVREYDRDAADEYWLVVDLVAPSEDSGELVIETAAAMIAAAADRGDRFGVAAGPVLLPPGGAARLDAALDVLAASQLLTTGPIPRVPAHPHICVLVTARGASAEWGDVIDVGGAP